MCVCVCVCERERESESERERECVCVEGASAGNAATLASYVYVYTLCVCVCVCVCVGSQRWQRRDTGLLAPRQQILKSSLSSAFTYQMYKGTDFPEFAAKKKRRRQWQHTTRCRCNRCERRSMRAWTLSLRDTKLNMNNFVILLLLLRYRTPWPATGMSMLLESLIHSWRSTCKCRVRGRRRTVKQSSSSECSSTNWSSGALTEAPTWEEPMCIIDLGTVRGLYSQKSFIQ